MSCASCNFGLKGAEQCAPSQIDLLIAIFAWLPDRLSGALPIICRRSKLFHITGDSYQNGEPIVEQFITAIESKKFREYLRERIPSKLPKSAMTDEDNSRRWKYVVLMLIWQRYVVRRQRDDAERSVICDNTVMPECIHTIRTTIKLLNQELHLLNGILDKCLKAVMVRDSKTHDSFVLGFGLVPPNDKQRHSIDHMHPTNKLVWGASACSPHDLEIIRKDDSVPTHMLPTIMYYFMGITDSPKPPILSTDDERTISLTTSPPLWLGKSAVFRNLVVVVGGMKRQPSSHPKIYEYHRGACMIEPTTGVEYYLSDLNVSRGDPVIGVVNETLLVVGGDRNPTRTPEGTRVVTAECITSEALCEDAEEAKWKMFECPPPDSCAAGASGCVVDNCLYVAGGHGSSMFVMWNGSTWIRLKDIPSERTDAASIDFQSRLWIIGGVDGEWQVTASVLVYDPIKDQWSEGPNLPSERQFCAATVVNGTPIVMGGQNNKGKLLLDVIKMGPDGKWCTDSHYTAQFLKAYPFGCLAPSLSAFDLKSPESF
tara:strand:+ start:359 stop:1981 length:1623 start_codon:yes stop_codon:yes gene_type:complete